MLKLQVVLVPPRALEFIQPAAGLTIPPSNNTLSNTSTLFKNGINPYDRSLKVPSNNSVSQLNSNVRNLLYARTQFEKCVKKFLVLTSPNNTLYELSNIIMDKLDKMYRDMDDDFQICTLQDNKCNDLDPDFIIKDVFCMNNVVRVLINKNIEFDKYSAVSKYPQLKRRKLNGKFEEPVQNSGQKLHGEVLAISKKRLSKPAPSPSSSTSGCKIAVPFTRVATSLSQEPYRDIDSIMLSSTGDESDLGQGTTFQPKSILSGLTDKPTGKLVPDDITSKAPNGNYKNGKTYLQVPQQETLLGTPRISTVTPNKLTPLDTNNDLIDVEEPEPMTTVIRHPPQTVITPKYANSENEPPSSKKRGDKSVDEESKTLRSDLKNKISGRRVPRSLERTSETDIRKKHELLPSRKMSLQRQQSSIADDKGSPMKNVNGTSDGSISDQVHLAELPDKRRKTESVETDKPKTKGKSIFEKIMENKHSELQIVNSTNKTTGNSELVQNRPSQHSPSVETTTKFTFDPASRILSSNENAHISDQDSQQNDSSLHSLSNSSFLKSDLIEMFANKDFDHLPWLGGSSRTHKISLPNGKSRKKPYLTVLNKDIDNSRPDPRNILPSRITRNAAKKAAQKLSSQNWVADTAHPTTSSETSGGGELYDSEDYSSDSSTGIVTEVSSEDEPARSFEPEKDLKLVSQSLKERVIEDHVLQSLNAKIDQPTKELENKKQQDKTVSYRGLSLNCRETGPIASKETLSKRIEANSRALGLDPAGNLRIIGGHSSADNFIAYTSGKQRLAKKDISSKGASLGNTEYRAIRHNFPPLLTAKNSQIQNTSNRTINTTIATTGQVTSSGASLNSANLRSQEVAKKQETSFQSSNNDAHDCSRSKSLAHLVKGLSLKLPSQSKKKVCFIRHRIV
ncbi:Net1p KNAG_0B05220 [Huiozyma naganishii CBS 8797]|uniref:Nucleolar protein Dnt1-like N-terminal domain-containing protein n=1 Tax=Huiozyma naganishii (strain ATCC MYA-139 / BCRC 22969 / CBS 8797 / KCTC 17520 / NBRC 10181 / NCYC 3082 / Yp74L-3) TaxID=1071383 RepID=J7R2B8_HUIN7|nr:hypothetical protein KNAG_0B05220 [Kazachstania naganishii CBS 8797]CCK68955.1 hypothetical protein KNAG_0B05220 [Kazachstania naganishii CBS 8797]